MPAPWSAVCATPASNSIRLTVEARWRGGAARALAARGGAAAGVRPSIQALNPLPTVLRAFRPTTGYEDVRSVAVARLAAPNIPDIQVDWTRYGPKLAQVALTFGADDVWGISGVRRRARRTAPRATSRRSAATSRRRGSTPVERDGRYVVIA